MTTDELAHLMIDAAVRERAELMNERLLGSEERGGLHSVGRSNGGPPCHGVSRPRSSEPELLSPPEPRGSGLNRGEVSIGDDSLPKSVGPGEREDGRSEPAPDPRPHLSERR